MRAMAVAASVALCACSSPVQRAEERYEIVKKTGKADDVCAQGRAVVAAYLEAQDAEKYAQRRVETDIECGSARTDETMGVFKMPDGSTQKIEADNMDAIAEPPAAAEQSIGNETNDPSNPCYKAGADC